MTARSAYQLDTLPFMLRAPLGRSLTIVLDADAAMQLMSDNLEWTPESIDELFSWTDFVATGYTNMWTGLVVVAPEQSFIEVFSLFNNAWAAWDQWVQRQNEGGMPTQLIVQYYYEGEPKYVTFGADPGSTAVRTVMVTIYAKEFFDMFETSYEAWRQLLHENFLGIPDMELWRSSTDDSSTQVYERFARGEVRVQTQIPGDPRHTREVVFIGCPSGDRNQIYQVPEVLDCTMNLVMGI